MGKQHLTQRRNPNVHLFPCAPKFPKTRSGDSIIQLDAAKSCLGKQVLNKNRSEPVINFNADSRDTRSKTQLCLTKLDTGPKAHMPKPVFYQPPLPMERVVMATGYG